MGMAFYIAVKWLVYTAWCYLGVRLFAPAVPHLYRRAALYGTLRLLMGVGIGLFIFFAALSMNNATRNAPLTYAAIYVPVRVLEWSLMYGIIRREKSPFLPVCSWILGGIAISCLADIPLGMMNGGIVPAGRPFC
jgi:hypothetical protein